jgi:hypothetical protein
MVILMHKILMFAVKMYHEVKDIIKWLIGNIKGVWKI